MSKKLAAIDELATASERGAGGGAGAAVVGGAASTSVVGGSVGGTVVGASVVVGAAVVVGAVVVGAVVVGAAVVGAAVVGAAVVGAAAVGSAVVGGSASPIEVVVGMVPDFASLVTAGGLEQLVTMATPTMATTTRGVISVARLTGIRSSPRPPGPRRRPGSPRGRAYAHLVIQQVGWTKRVRGPQRLA